MFAFGCFQSKSAAVEWKLLTILLYSPAPSFPELTTEDLQGLGLPYLNGGMALLREEKRMGPEEGDSLGVLPSSQE